MKLIKCILVTLVFLFELPSIISGSRHVYRQNILPQDVYCDINLLTGYGNDATINCTAFSTSRNRYTDCVQLNSTSDDGGVAWTVLTTDSYKWIEFDICYVKSVSGLLTQALSNRSPYVTYTVSWFNNDTQIFEAVYNEDGTEVYKGNTDPNTTAIRVFNSTVYCQRIRIYPLDSGTSIPLSFTLLDWYSFKQLGVEDGTIIPERLIASSILIAGRSDPDRGRLNKIHDNVGYGAWLPLFYDKTPWIQADLGGVILVIGVATQGRSDFASWVWSYNVLYSDIGITYEMVENDNKTFEGNWDQNTIVVNMFDSAVNGEFFRIYPTKWNVIASLRFDLLRSCPASSESTTSTVSEVSITSADLQPQLQESQQLQKFQMCQQLNADLQIQVNQSQLQSESTTSTVSDVTTTSGGSTDSGESASASSESTTSTVSEVSTTSGASTGSASSESTTSTVSDVRTTSGGPTDSGESASASSESTTSTVSEVSTTSGASTGSEKDIAFVAIIIIIVGVVLMIVASGLYVAFYYIKKKPVTGTRVPWINSQKEHLNNGKRRLANMYCDI